MLDACAVCVMELLKTDRDDAKVRMRAFYNIVERIVWTRDKGESLVSFYFFKNYSNQMATPSLFFFSPFF